MISAHRISATGRRRGCLASPVRSDRRSPRRGPLAEGVVERARADVAVDHAERVQREHPDAASACRSYRPPRCAPARPRRGSLPGGAPSIGAGSRGEKSSRVGRERGGLVAPAAAPCHAAGARRDRMRIAKPRQRVRAAGSCESGPVYEPATIWRLVSVAVGFLRRHGPLGRPGGTIKRSLGPLYAGAAITFFKWRWLLVPLPAHAQPPLAGWSMPRLVEDLGGGGTHPGERGGKFPLPRGHLSIPVTLAIQSVS